MAVLLLIMFSLAMFGSSDAATWCVCRTDVSTSAQQKTLDYACGAGADCSPILQNGACYNPNTVSNHCSYAANSYFQRKGQAQGSCDFAGTALTTQSDPSSSGCSYPSSVSAAGTSSTTTSTGTSTPTSTGTPSTFSPSTGITGTGGVLGGLGPTGTSTSSLDSSDGGLLQNAGMGSLFLTIFFPAIMAILKI